VFPGVSGNYRMDATGRLHRDPAWAVFANGRPRPLPPPQPELENAPESGSPIAGADTPARRIRADGE
jgi:hypothetical protein